MAVLVGIGALIIILSVRWINSMFRATAGPGEAVIGGALGLAAAVTVGGGLLLIAAVAFPILLPIALAAIIAALALGRRKRSA